MNLNAPLEMIVNNPWQTRTVLNQEYIAELAEDIAANGLLQVPLGRIVHENGDALSQAEALSLPSRIPATMQVQLAFGHNRLAAYRLNLESLGVGWKLMPAEIRVLTDEQMADYAWSENEKRRDHTALERAKAIQKRIEDFGWTHEQVAEHLHISRSVVSNALRLLTGLPENILQAMGEDKLNERSAVALLSLFALPEAFRKEAEKQPEYSWDTLTTLTKPSRIIAGALDGDTSDRTRQRIESLIEKYGAKLSGAPWKYGDDFGELLAGVDLPENLSLNALRSATCKACEHRLESHICLDSDCFDIKSDLWKIHLLEIASRARGIPYLMPDEAERYPRTGLNEYDSRKFTAEIMATNCENLRLVHSDGIKKDAIDAAGANIRIICQKRTGSCQCLLGLQARERNARSEAVSRGLNPDAMPQPESQGPPVITGRPLAEVFEQEELEEAARVARREKKASLERVPALKEQAAQIIAIELLNLNLRLWVGIIRRFHWKIAKELDALDAQNISYEKIAELLGKCLAENNMPEDDSYFRSQPDPENYAKARLNRFLSEMGCPEINQIQPEKETT